MNIEMIETYIVLANCRNFTKTAELLHVVQSTVSNRIRSLEAYVGTQLVIRDKNGIQLTEEGKLFLEYANSISALDKSALQEVHMLKNYDDRLNVGAIHWLYHHWIADYVIRYSATFPRVAVNVTVAHSEDLIPLLQNQLLDAAFLTYELTTANLFSAPFNISEIVFVGSSKAFGHLKTVIKKDELVKLPLIYSDIWENYLSDLSDHILPAGKLFKIHCNLLSDAREFFLAGAGCGFLPRKLVEEDLNSGQLIQIPISDLPVKYVQTYVVYNRQRVDSVAMKGWLDLVGKEYPAGE